MRRLLGSTSSFLRSRLAHQSAAIAFAEAVVSQLAHPPGTVAEDPVEAEAAGAGAVVRLLWLSEDPSRAAEAVELLASDGRFLAAVFQNADLLYLHAFPYADAVSLRTLAALHRAEEPGPS